MTSDKPAPKRRRRKRESDTCGSAVTEANTSSEAGASYVLDDRTGLLLPEGARAKKRQPGFGADWSE